VLPGFIDSGYSFYIDTAQIEILPARGLRIPTVCLFSGTVTTAKQASVPLLSEFGKNHNAYVRGTQHTVSAIPPQGV
jgi:hypothetical protein